jgi:hypothetical protein
MVSSITKQELKYVIGAVIFSALWFLAFMPYLLDKGIEDASPYIQFLVFNIGIFIFLQIFLKARTLKKGINLKNSVGIIALVMAIDTLIPPFLVTRGGELLNHVILRGSASDYIFGHFAISSLGLSGIFVFLFTYILMPALLLFVAAHLLPNLVRNV